LPSLVVVTNVAAQNLTARAETTPYSYRETVVWNLRVLPVRLSLTAHGSPEKITKTQTHEASLRWHRIKDRCESRRKNGPQMTRMNADFHGYQSDLICDDPRTKSACREACGLLLRVFAVSFFGFDSLINQNPKTSSMPYRPGFWLTIHLAAASAP